ncbi:hypothetical protein HYV21_02595 [Candidatus Microgenomates bacterium]|nr:hypothetical protein [Candidatus Microgenomates bacterium]
MAKGKKVTQIPPVRQVSTPSSTRGAQGKQVSKILLWVGGGIILIISFANLTVWSRNVIAQWRREPIEKEIAQWEQIVQETPTYRDGYLKLATLYWKLHEDKKSQEALNRAEEIDPNYEETRELKMRLGY